MKPIEIVSVGTVHIQDRYGKAEFISSLPSAKFRRANRLSLLATESAKKALQNFPEQDFSAVGTVFSTGFGSSLECMKFAKSVEQNAPDLCSPILFSQTAPNCFLGQVCMFLGCKGSSTVFMGSNHIGYAQMLLNKKSDSFILSGSMEEYNEELFSIIPDRRVSEGAVCFLLSETLSKNGCRLLDFQECDIGGFPLATEIDTDYATQNILSLLNNSFIPDRIFIADCGTFSTAERNLYKKKYPGIPLVSNKEKYGETLGVAFSFNLLDAYFFLQKNEKKNVLVAGCDLNGNYYIYQVSNQ